MLASQGPASRRPFDGVFVLPLEVCSDLHLFHGTAPNRLPEIRANGLRPPADVEDKLHGFYMLEGKLRYVGRDLEAAEAHAREGTIVELTYTGLIALTDLHIDARQVQHLLAQLPAAVGGIQYVENGRSIAFRPEASLQILRRPAAEAPANRPRLSAVSRWLRGHLARVIG